MTIYNFISLSGIFILIFFCWLISSNRREINWHVIVWGISLQLIIAWFLFVVPSGTKLFLFLNDVVVKILDSSAAGARFVFGPLALPPGTTGEHGEQSIGFILTFQAFPSIIFFSSLMSILYYYNIIPKIIKAFAYLFTRLMKVSGAESMCTASNIFVGIESTLTIRPFLRKMTRSELCTVLTAGMATISSNIMAVYVFSLKDVFPNIAGHLISASLLSAPAALMTSKLLLPETEKPETLGEAIDISIEKEGSVFEAVINGAMAGGKLIFGIMVLLIAVLGIVALFDQLIIFLGDRLNALLHLTFDWSMRNLLSLIFYPFTLLLGVPLKDAALLAQIIGERVILTEVVSYQDLAKTIAQGSLSQPRSAIIASYALCGFSHFASMAIFIGGISAVVPEKTKILAQIGFRALIAATIACLMTGCVAGIFLTDSVILFGK